MNIGMIILGTLVGGVLLFLWNGFTQNVVPWGIKSVKTPAGPDEEKIGSAIAAVTTNGMHLLTKQVTAFMAIRPASFYSAGRYLGIEFLTQVIVALVLTVILALTIALPFEQRLLLTVLVSLVGVAAIDLQYWNWWGFSTKYTLGIATSRVIGHTIVGFLLINFIVRV
jgi:hypothetical protein